MDVLGEICRSHELLSLNADMVIRVPFLVKGSLRAPPRVKTAEILDAFAAREGETGRGSE